jgi:hypothetical protein
VARQHHLVTTTSEPITARTTTSVRAGVRIPQDVLNEQSYQARFRLRVMPLDARAGSTAIVVAEQRLDFPVMNPHPEESVWRDWPWGRGGLISPRLAWHVDEAR